MTRVIRVCIAVSVAAAALLVAAATPAVAASALAKDQWSIYADHRNWIIPKGGATGNSTPIVLSDPINTEIMNWYFEPTRTTSDGTWYHIRNVASSKCLNVQGGSLSNSAYIILYTCGSNNDEWLPLYVGTKDPLPDDYYILENYKSRKCLNVQGGGSAVGTRIIQYTCNVNADNEWFTWTKRV